MMRPMLNLPYEEVTKVFHGLGPIAQSPRLYVENVLIIFWVIGMGIPEEMYMDEKEEWQWQK
jgi:hypothetical protein